MDNLVKDGQKQSKQPKFTVRQADKTTPEKTKEKRPQKEKLQSLFQSEKSPEKRSGRATTEFKKQCPQMRT